MRKTRHVVLPVRSWQHVGLMIVSLSCLTLGLVSRDREGQAGNLAGPDLQHCAPHKVDVCPNANAITGQPSYDDSVSPSGIILNDQLNDHRVTEVRNAPENRGVRNLRVSRLDVGRLSSPERRDARRRSSIRNTRERRGGDEERNRESLSVDRNSRLRVRRTRERDSSSFSSSRRDTAISERRIRTSESRITRLTTTRGDREDRERSRRRETGSLKREIVNEYSRSRKPEDQSVERRDDRRGTRRVSSERDSETSAPRRVVSERRDRRSDRRAVRDTRKSFENSLGNELSAVRRYRVVRSVDRDSETGSSRLRAAERRDVRYSRQADDSAMRETRVREESRRISERISESAVDRRRVREIRSLPRKTLDNFVGERRDQRRIKRDEIRNRKFLERDSRSENRHEFTRTNSLRGFIRDVKSQDRTVSGERSSNHRLENPERFNSRRRIEGINGIKIDRIETFGAVKEDANRRESRSRSRSSTRKSEPTFMGMKNWEERIPSSSSTVYYEGAKQTAIVVLCLAYGVSSLYGGKGSLSRNIMMFANRFVVW